MCARDGKSDSYIYQIDNQLMYGSSVKQIGLVCRAHLLRMTKKYCHEQIGILARKYMDLARKEKEKEKEKQNENENENENENDNDNDNKNEDDEMGSHFKQAKNETNKMRSLREHRKEYLRYTSQCDTLITQVQHEIAQYNATVFSEAPDCHIGSFDEYDKVDKVTIPCNIYFDIEFVNNNLNLDKFEIWGNEEMKKSCGVNQKYLMQVQGMADPIALHLKVGINNSRVLMETKGIGTVHEIELPRNFFPEFMKLNPHKIWSFSYSEVEMAKMHVTYQLAMNPNAKIFTDWNMELDEKSNVKNTRRSKWFPSTDVTHVANCLVSEACYKWNTKMIDEYEKDAKMDQHELGLRRMFRSHIRPFGTDKIFELPTRISLYEEMAIDMEPDVITPLGKKLRNASQYTYVYPSISDQTTLHIDSGSRLRPMTDSTMRLIGLTSNATIGPFTTFEYDTTNVFAEKAVKREQNAITRGIMVQYASLYSHGML